MAKAIHLCSFEGGETLIWTVFLADDKVAFFLFFLLFVPINSYIHFFARLTRIYRKSRTAVTRAPKSFVIPNKETSAPDDFDACFSGKLKSPSSQSLNECPKKLVKINNAQSREWFKSDCLSSLNFYLTFWLELSHAQNCICFKQYIHERTRLKKTKNA